MICVSCSHLSTMHTDTGHVGVMCYVIDTLGRRCLCGGFVAPEAERIYQNALDACDASRCPDGSTGDVYPCRSHVVAAINSHLETIRRTP